MNKPSVHFFPNNTEDISSIMRQSVMSTKESMNHKEKMTPTDHFKSHCGKEWLNSEGKLSIDNILEYIDQQIQFRNIKIVNNYIITDKWLQDLLQDYRPSIHKDELAVIAHKFFA